MELTDRPTPSHGYVYLGDLVEQTRWALLD